ncbi:MAG: hypothetical protein ACTSW1_19115 [Candidatus Hodarchaeales archaeon]
MLEIPKKGSLYVLVGNYEQTIDQLLLSNIKGVSIVPSVLWIDYRIIPIAKISRNFKTFGLKSLNEIFFLEINSVGVLEKLIKSGELNTAAKHTFRTIIINIPQHLPNDILLMNELDKLAEKMIIILFTKKKTVKTINSVVLEIVEE